MTRTHSKPAHRRPVTRRSFLGISGSVALGGVAGCLGAGGNPDTYLDPPDTPADPEDLAYPAFGQLVPDVSLPAAIADRSVPIREREATVLLTFYFSYCESVCPRLISTLRNVQAAADEGGWADQVEFMPVTFDPERDTAARLGEYADANRIDLEAGNWYFLRPESVERAEAVVTDEFGVKFERVDENPADASYMFTHIALILVVNPDGYVERAYTDSQPVWQDVRDDVKTVVDSAAAE